MKKTPKSMALRADKEAEGKEGWQKACSKHGKKDCKECKKEYKEDHEKMG